MSDEFLDTSKFTPEQKARYAELEDKYSSDGALTEDEVQEYCELMVILGKFVKHGDDTYGLP